RNRLLQRLDRRRAAAHARRAAGEERLWPVPARAAGAGARRMKVQDLGLGCRLVEPRVFGDERGSFYESWNGPRWAEEGGLDLAFVQSNVSRSQRGVLRGLHYQWPQAQGQLVTVLVGGGYEL